MNFVGKICPYCKGEFKEDDDIIICSVCEMPHHKECWIENQGCTTFGCTGTIMRADNLFCGNCGSPFTDGEEICASCGNLRPKPQGQPQYENQTYYNQQNSNYKTVNVDDDIQALIENNQEYYYKRFQKFNNSNSKTSWNWASAILGGYWYAYRKMYLIQFLYYIAYYIAMKFFYTLSAALFLYKYGYTPGLTISILLILFVPFVLSGLFGNYLYKCHVQKHAQIANSMDGYMKHNYLMSKGGTNSGAVWFLIIARILLKFIVNI